MLLSWIRLKPLVSWHERPCSWPSGTNNFLMCVHVIWERDISKWTSRYMIMAVVWMATVSCNKKEQSWPFSHNMSLFTFVFFFNHSIYSYINCCLLHLSNVWNIRDNFFFGQSCSYNYCHTNNLRRFKILCWIQMKKNLIEKKVNFIQPSWFYDPSATKLQLL